MTSPVGSRFPQGREGTERARQRQDENGGGGALRIWAAAVYSRVRSPGALLQSPEAGSKPGVGTLPLEPPGDCNKAPGERTRESGEQGLSPWNCTSSVCQGCFGRVWAGPNAAERPWRAGGERSDAIKNGRRRTGKTAGANRLQSGAGRGPLEKNIHFLVAYALPSVYISQILPVPSAPRSQGVRRSAAKGWAGSHPPPYAVAGSAGSSFLSHKGRLSFSRASAQVGPRPAAIRGDEWGGTAGRRGVGVAGGGDAVWKEVNRVRKSSPNRLLCHTVVIHPFCASWEVSNANVPASKGVHADRAAGGDRHHRHPDRPAAARRPEGPRGRRTHRLQQQPAADRPRGPQLRQRQRPPAPRHQRRQQQLHGHTALPAALH